MQKKGHLVDQMEFSDSLKEALCKLDLSNLKLTRVNDILKNFSLIVKNNFTHTFKTLESDLKDLEKFVDQEEGLHLINNLSKKIERIEKNFERLAEIIEVENADDLCAEAIFFDDVIKDIQAEFKQELLDKKSTIIYNFYDCPSILYLKPFIQSIFRNLISNALEYAVPGRAVKIDISSTLFEEYVLVVLKDNCMGIDYTKILFRPFSDPLKNTIEGTGLYLVKNIIEKNGGIIQVHSVAGEGATFYCFLRPY